MEKEMMQKAEELAARNYSLTVYEDKTSNGQTIFLAKNPELYGCMAQGVSLEDAIKNLEEARVDYICSLLEDNLEVPEPAPEAVITVDTASPVQFDVQATVQFKDVMKSITEPVHRKPMYEASLRT